MILRTLEFDIRGQRLEKREGSDFSGLVAGTAGYLRAKFWFYGNEWRGCAKAASFFVDGVEHAAMLDSNDACIIPKEALTGHKFYVSVTGIRKGFKIKTTKTDVKQEVI